ncbi:DUF2508 family protein [Thermobrachium celere]|uniref:DUF2508 family protein n=2 Tax=Thermobrachium TaxID=150333 RepID=R7RUP8_9CLOT|nr:DUF2508 family protein [Thermobrachium celere]GFR35551.1 hypothetical protein TCEA9_13630 [Thermobrachium celere]CDF59140.1 hypothetical protein TCEL_02208 [Thermobrachium celere DSM 8682]
MDGHVSTIDLIERAIKVISSPKVEENKELMEVKNEIERTLLEIKNAQEIFKYSTDPDIIDYAIFKEKAEFARLCYLFKVARRINNIVNF